MATFTYDAVDSSGRSIQDRIEAESETQVLTRLHSQGLHVLQVSEQRASTFSLGARQALGAAKLQSLVVFSRQFATMIDAGLSVLKCIDILASQTKDVPLRHALDVVKKDVQGGVALADALAKHPNCFSKLYVNMIRAAELGGILDTILDRLAGFLEKEQEIRQKVKSALTYPTIVLCFALGMLNAMFYFVLPTFKQIFTEMDVAMPPMTAALFAVSDFMRTFWYIMLGLPFGGWFAFRQYHRTPQGAYQIDRVKLKLPVFGDLILKLAIARFARTFGTLLSSGVPIMRTMEIISETAGNALLAEAILKTKADLREGKRLGTPLLASGLFPPMVTHMIDVGEETGRLSEMLVKVADFYESEVDATVKALTSLIEPILIVFLGVVVGFIVISIMAPMFKLVSSING
ncbi:MAG: type II secretion system F family protein [Armatimonadota bacterium]